MASAFNVQKFTLILLNQQQNQNFFDLVLHN